MFLMKIFSGLLFTFLVLVGFYIIQHFPSLAVAGYLYAGIGLMMIYISGVQIGTLPSANMLRKSKTSPVRQQQNVVVKMPVRGPKM